MAGGAQVLSFQTGGALAVAQLGPTGAPTHVTSIAGTVVASLPGQTTVTASLVGVPVFVGSVQVTQVTSPWITFVGSTGQHQGTVVASLIGQATVAASVVGQLTVTASLIGVPAFVGSVQVTQASSPWITRAGSNGQFLGFVVASLPGQTTVTASCVGQQTVTASVVGQQFVTASFAAPPSFVGSVRVSAFNTALATTRVFVSTSGTALPTTALTNRGRVILYHRGNITNTASSATVYLGNTGVNSSTGWPLEYGGTLQLELGPSVTLFAAAVGSFGTPVNSGQEIAILELA